MQPLVRAGVRCPDHAHDIVVGLDGGVEHPLPGFFALLEREATVLLLLELAIEDFAAVLGAFALLHLRDGVGDLIPKPRHVAMGQVALAFEKTLDVVVAAEVGHETGERLVDTGEDERRLFLGDHVPAILMFVVEPADRVVHLRHVGNLVTIAGDGVGRGASESGQVGVPQPQGILAIELGFARLGGTLVVRVCRIVGHGDVLSG